MMRFLTPRPTAHTLEQYAQASGVARRTDAAGGRCAVPDGLGRRGCCAASARPVRRQRPGSSLMRWSTRAA